jgi:hypothetical protein
VIFGYPDSHLDRVHGPAGYASYESFRPWLRDEFTFRCAYCLKRETWGQITGEFNLDHFEPQSLAPHRRLDYFNLIYACQRCNAVKFDEIVDDPLTVLNSSSVTIGWDGAIESEHSSVQRLIRQLDLNSPRLRKWRMMWMRIVNLAQQHDPELYRQLTGFPTDLPDLRRLRPPTNSRPDGLEMSWYAKRQRGQLPDAY